VVVENKRRESVIYFLSIFFIIYNFFPLSLSHTHTHTHRLLATKA
jgi:hypothetical protein